MRKFYRLQDLVSLGCLCFLFSTVSCGRVGPLYIEAPEEGHRAETAKLHFFFDRTESLEGFTAKGDASQYVKTLPLLWQIGDNSFAASTARFFEFGENFTKEFADRPEATRLVKTEVLKKGFYGFNPPNRDLDRIREPVKNNNNLPFTAVSDYIWKELEDNQYKRKPGNAYIIVTDFYEQDRENPFSRFFRDAFSRGLSGSLFAVESTFSGKINSFSYVNPDDSIQVPDGISTFFIFIVGDSDIVYTYSAALDKELNDKKINFHNAVFMVDAQHQAKPHHGDPVMVPDARRYGKNENALRLVNLRPQEVSFINHASPDRIEAYQILTKIGSRWAAGLPLKNINPDNFKYKAEPSFFYFDGKRTKTEGNNGASSFTGIANFTGASANLIPFSDIDKESIPENAGNFPFYLLIQTKNQEIKKGWYSIKYNILSEAVQRPVWVSELNAGDIPALKQSVSDGRVKVLELTNVYEKIADAYNSQARIIYSDKIYLVKK